MDTLTKWASSCTGSDAGTVRQTTNALAAFRALPDGMASWCNDADDASVMKLVSACAAATSSDFIAGACHALGAEAVAAFVSGRQVGGGTALKRRRVIDDDDDDDSDDDSDGNSSAGDDEVVVHTTALVDGSFYSVLLHDDEGTGYFRADGPHITWLYTYDQLTKSLSKDEWPEKPPGACPLYISTHTQPKLGADTPVSEVRIQSSRNANLDRPYLAGIFNLEGPPFIIPFTGNACRRDRLFEGYIDFLCARGNSSSRKLRKAVESAPMWDENSSDSRLGRKMKCSACQYSRRIDTVVTLAGTTHCLGRDCAQRIRLAWDMCHRRNPANTAEFHDRIARLA